MNSSRNPKGTTVLTVLAMLIGLSLGRTTAVLAQDAAEVEPQAAPKIPFIQKDVMPDAGPQAVKPTDDQLEPNDSSAEAARIQAGQYELEGWDQDWFVFEVPAEGAITITIEGPQGDLDLYLFDASGNELARSIAYGSYEQVWGTAASGTHTIVVAPYENQGSSYLLTLVLPEAQPEEPEEPEQPTEPEEPEDPGQPTEPEEPENPGQTETDTGRVLLVGIDHYDPSYGASSLPSCINDANGMRTLLVDGASGRWASENVQVLTDGQATKAAIRGALQCLAGQSGPDDAIVYYHSSHGGQTSGTDTYLCTYDSSYTDAELGSDLALFSASQRVIVIVDACHSGGLFKDADWPFAKQIMKTYKMKKTAQLLAKGVVVPKDLGSNIGFMTACNYDETCSAGAVYSLYTEYLIKACSLSSADANGDGHYQFWEMYAYAAAEASSRNRSQTAQYSNQALLESTVARTGEAGGTSDGGDPLAPIPLLPGPCGAGAAQALVVGLVGLLGIAAPSRRRTYSVAFEADATGHDQA